MMTYSVFSFGDRAMPFGRSLVATSRDTVRSRSYTGKPCRTIRNPYNASWEGRTDEIQPFPMQYMHSAREGVVDYTGRNGDADPERSFMPAGQGLGMIDEIKPAAEIMRDLIAETEKTLAGLAAHR